jgi:hypothetical protein
LKYKNIFGNEYSGTLGDDITGSSWKGVLYLRKHFAPTNPRAGLQVTQRDIFTCAVSAWRGLSRLQKMIYNRLAGGKHLSGFNLFVKRVIRFMRTGTRYQPPAELEISVKTEEGQPVKTAVLSVIHANDVIYKSDVSTGATKIALTYEDEPYDIVVEAVGYQRYEQLDARVDEIDTSIVLKPMPVVCEALITRGG